MGKRSYAIPRGTARTLTIALDTATLTLLEQHGSHGRIHVRANATIRRGRASTRTISLQAA